MTRQGSRSAHERVAADDRFWWERSGLDFPLYRDPGVSAVGAWVLIVSTMSVLAYLFLPVRESPAFKALVVLLVPLLTYLWVSRADLGGIVLRPRWADAGLVLAAVVLQVLYTFVVARALESVPGFGPYGNGVGYGSVDVGRVVLALLQLVGEELFKVNQFLGTLTLLYRATGRRGMCVVVSAILCLLAFALGHLPACESLSFVLVFQGLGSVFCVFAYLKSKNVLIP